MKTRYRLCLLGGLYLTRDRLIAEGAAANRKPLALMALLAVAGDAGVSRDRAAGILWGDSSESQARALLKQCLYVLRKSLGGDPLISGSTTMRLNRTICTTDLWDLESAIEDGRVEEAVKHFRGPLLDGVYLNDHPTFQRWVESERDRLANRMQTSLRRTAAQLESAGKHADAAEVWSALVEQDPLSDRNELGLVRALVASGDRAAGRQRVRRYRALVKRELETDLSVEVERAFKVALESAGSPIIG